jgi:hypothetical protein
MGQESDGGSFLSSLPFAKGLKAGKIVLNPSFQVGYQHIGSNLTIPASAAPHGPDEIFVGPMDVSLDHFNFWFGTLGLNVIASPLTLFGLVSGYAPGPFQMTGLIPVSDNQNAVAPAVTLAGSHLNFWSAQCGVGYTICGDYSILAGFAWSHTAAEFTNPSVDSVPLPNQTLQGDVSLDIGVPFIGVQVLREGNYRAALLYSPLARSSGALSLKTTAPRLRELRYSLDQPGSFLAVNGEYYFVFKPPVILSCWLIGSYLNIRGTSDLEFTGAAVPVARDVTITNTQYGISGGFTCALAF